MAYKPHYYKKQRVFSTVQVQKYADPQNCGFDSQTASSLIALVKNSVVPTNASDLIKNLLKSFSEQYNKYGHLSQKQWQLVNKHNIVSPVQATAAVASLPGMPVPNGVNLIINRSAAFREFKYKFKLKYGIFAIKVLSIDQAGKARNGNTWANLTVEPDYDSPVSACRVCGKTLTDAKSIGCGIGPECAKNTGIWRIYKSGNAQQIKDAFKASVSAALQNKPVEIKLWTSQIKDGKIQYDTAMNMYFGNVRHQINAIARNKQPVAAPISQSVSVNTKSINPYVINWSPSRTSLIQINPNNNCLLETTLAYIDIMCIDTIIPNSERWNKLEIHNKVTGNIVGFELSMTTSEHYIFYGMHKGMTITLKVSK